MKSLEISPSLIDGIIFTSGSKNIALPIICACLLINDKITIGNVPDILDVRNLLEILSEINVKNVFTNNKLTIDSKNILIKKMPFEMIKKMRASYYLLGALLPQFDNIEFTFPGGCAFQERPIDLHLMAFENLGIEFNVEDEFIKFDSKNIKNGIITFSKKSVGATINALLCCCQIPGVSIINNPSLDYEVIEVINFINQIGGHILIEDNYLKIEGRKNFNLINNYYIKPDRIEIGTYALLGASKGRILIVGIDINSLKALFNLFDKLKISYSYTNDYLLVDKSNVSYPLYIKLDSDPSFPTDLGPILCAFLLKNKKISIIEDSIYPKRNQYVEELKKMGAKIQVINNKIVIFPFSKFISATLYGKDLRGAMSLIVGGLISDQKQDIYGYSYLIRGYESLITKLRNINVNIKEIEK